MKVEAIMTRALRLLVSVGITLSSAIPAAGQWLNHPSKGIPLTSDGRADLNAPPPRTADGHPDLSGIWGSVRPLYTVDRSSQGPDTCR
jgi:hypothetical protein